jgi:bifunctional DNA-binding transcriptional regulator/antitoxin component of YhaV-PrlF toxin-antitoxin module/uncharacterized protein YdeI (BOF family)
MKYRSVISVIAFSLLATIPAWGQTTIIRRQASTESRASGKKLSKSAKEQKQTPSAGNASTSKEVPQRKWAQKGAELGGLIVVQDENEKWGFVDKSGELVIPCKWKSAGGFVQNNNGLSYVKDDNDKCGFIDKTGRIVIPCKWRSASNFQEGLSLVIDENRHYGYIDFTGTIVIPCKWIQANDFSEGLAMVGDKKCGYIDKTGHVVIPCKWKRTYSFSEGLAYVQDDNGKYGYIDKTGKIV